MTVPTLSETSVYKSKCISKYSRESFFFLKGNLAIRFTYWNDDSGKFEGFRKNGGFDYIAFHIKVFLGNEYNGYIHTARNAKVTSIRIVYEKTLMKRKVFRGVSYQFQIQQPIWVALRMSVVQVSADDTFQRFLFIAACSVQIKAFSYLLMSFCHFVCRMGFFSTASNNWLEKSRSKQFADII